MVKDGLSWGSSSTPFVPPFASKLARPMHMSFQERNRHILSRPGLRTAQIIPIAFYWAKQVTRAARLQEMEK